MFSRAMRNKKSHDFTIQPVSIPLKSLETRQQIHIFDTDSQMPQIVFKTARNCIDPLKLIFNVAVKIFSDHVVVYV